MDFAYTRQQVARGSRPDAVVGVNMYLFKNVLLLRLTYQIRLLTFLSAERGGVLIIRIPHGAELSADLRSFVNERPVVSIERVA